MITETMPSAPELSVSAAPANAVTRLAMRQLRRSGPIVLAPTAGMPALVASTYTTIMADPAATSCQLLSCDFLRLRHYNSVMREMPGPLGSA